MFEAYALARVADDPAPAERHACLDAHPGANACREHFLLVRSILLGKPFHAGHGHHPGGDALLLQCLAGGERDLHLAAGPDEDHCVAPALAALPALTALAALRAF